MNRRLVRVLIPLTIAAAMPLLAEQKKTESAEAKKAKPAQTEASTAAAPAAASTTATPAVQESPLVAAARRMNRLGKKPANVITNDTLAKSGGTAHITTSNEAPKPIILSAGAPAPTPEMAAAAKVAEQRKAAETAAADARKTEEERRQRVNTGRAMAEESIEERYEADAESYQADQPETPPPSQF